jgi:hypothetical protein
MRMLVFVAILFSHAESDVATHSRLHVSDEGVMVIVPEPPVAPNVAAEDTGESI